MSHYALPCLGTSLVAIPTPRSHCAPHFSGEIGDPIEGFLCEYEELVDSCGLSEREKVENVIRYIPPSLRYFWKSLGGYSTHDWTVFRQELVEFYDDPPPSSRYYKRKRASGILLE
jgi:hypothetical protein